MSLYCYFPLLHCYVETSRVYTSASDLIHLCSFIDSVIRRFLSLQAIQSTAKRKSTLLVHPFFIISHLIIPEGNDKKKTQNYKKKENSPSNANRSQARDEQGERRIVPIVVSSCRSNTDDNVLLLLFYVDAYRIVLSTVQS